MINNDFLIGIIIGGLLTFEFLLVISLFINIEDNEKEKKENFKNCVEMTQDNMYCYKKIY